MANNLRVIGTKILEELQIISTKLSIMHEEKNGVKNHGWDFEKIEQTKKELEAQEVENDKKPKKFITIPAEKFDEYEADKRELAIIKYWVRDLERFIEAHGNVQNRPFEKSIKLKIETLKEYLNDK